jgi:DNA-binding CsgD family transcriptional regulator
VFSDTSPVPLLGRDREAAAVGQVLRAEPSGLAVIGIVGPAGIGKTRLWQAALHEAAGRDLLRLCCRPNEAEASLPYAGLDDLLRTVPPAAFDALAGPLRHALDVALLRTDPTGSPVSQRAVALAVCEVLRTLAGEGPLLLAIDDAQWLDPPTAFVLRFSLRRLEHHPIVVLTALRSDGEPNGETVLPLGLDRVLIEDRGRVLKLAPLEPQALGELIRTRFGVHLAPGRLRALHHQSGGNPLFALELGRALASGRDAGAVDPFLPLSGAIRTMLSGRIESLSRPVREMLAFTAALARPSIRVLAAAGGSAAEVDAQLRTAIDVGVLEVDAERVAFTHPLLASVVYDGLHHDERRAVHGRLAAIVAEVEEAARHAALAAEGPDAAVAAQVEEAVHRASARGAPDSAAQLAHLAHRLTPSDQPVAARRRAMLAAEHLLNAGETPQARQVLTDLAAALPPGADRAPVLRLLAQVCSYDEGHVSALPLLRAALTDAGPDDGLRAHVERDLTACIVQAGDVREALPHALAGLRAAEASGSPPLIVAALTTLAMVEFLVGHGMRADLLQRATELGLEPSEHATPPGFLPVDLIRGVLLKWADQPDLARDLIHVVRERAKRLSEESAWGSLLFQLGELELWTGDIEAADVCATAAEDITRRSGQTAQQTHAAYLRAAISAQRDDLARARRHALETLTEADRVGDLRFRLRTKALLGAIELRSANPEGALAHLDTVAEEYADAGYGDPGVIRFQADHIDALIEMEQLERAERQIETLDDVGAALERPRLLALAHRCRGSLLLARGDLHGARSSLRSAVEGFEGLPFPLELGRSLLVLGATRRRLKEKRAAREDLGRAIDIFTAIDARGLVLQAEAERRRIGGRATVTTLTPTEQQMASLVIEGFTNAEVARTLFVSVKTVENTLTRVYRKIGVRSRRELASRYRAHGTLDLPGPIKTSSEVTG